MKTSVGLSINFLFLVLSDAVPVKVIPGERKVVKKGGTTHTISRYYVVPDDFHHGNVTNNSSQVLRTSNAAKTNVRHGKSAVTANPVILHNKGISKQSGKGTVDMKDNVRPNVSAVDAETLVSNNTQENVLDGSFLIKVEPISNTDLILRLNETKSLDEGLLETISSTTNNTQGVSDTYTEKQQNLIMSLFGAEVNEKEKVNIHNFWKLVRHYIAAVPNQVELMSRIEKLSTFLDVYKILNQKSKRMPIEPVIDELIDVLQKRKSSKKETHANSDGFDNQGHLDLHNDNLRVKVYADSGQIKNSVPFNILRSELKSLNDSSEGVVNLNISASDPKSDKTTKNLSNTITEVVIKTPKIKDNKTKSLPSLIEDENLKNLLLTNEKEELKKRSQNLKNTTPTTQTLNLKLKSTKRQPLIENITWEGQPWAIEDKKNEVPLIIIDEIPKKVVNLAIEEGTENYMPLSVHDRTKQGPSIYPSIKSDDPSIIKENDVINDDEWVKYDEPSSVDGRANEEPAIEPRMKYEEPFITEDKTENSWPWMNVEEAKNEKPLSIKDRARKEPLIYHKIKYGKPLITKKIMKNDLPRITGEWVKYDEPFSVHSSTKQEPGTESIVKYNEPLIIEKRTENDTPWITDEWVNYDKPLTVEDSVRENPSNNHKIKYGKPLIIKESMENDVPWITDEWMKYAGPLSVDDSFREKPWKHHKIKYGKPLIIKENTENYIPWINDEWEKYAEQLSDKDRTRKEPSVHYRIKYGKPLISEKGSESDWPWVTGEWVKDGEPFNVDNSMKQEPGTEARIQYAEPLIIEERTENNWPWITGEWGKYDEPFSVDSIIKKEPGTEPRVKYGKPLIIKERTENDVPWITDEWVKYAEPLNVHDSAREKSSNHYKIKYGKPLITVKDDKPLNVDINTKQEPGTEPRIQYYEPLITEKRIENNWPWITGAWVKYDKPLTIEKNTENDVPWITDEWVKYDEPLNVDDSAKEKPLNHHKIKYGEPLITEKRTDNDWPWIIGEPLGVDSSTKQEHGTDPMIKYNIPKIIEEKMENNWPWITGQWVKHDETLSDDDKAHEEPLINHSIKTDGKPLITEEGPENVMPGITGTLVNYDEPVIINDSTKQEPWTEEKIKYGKPLIIEKRTENDWPWVTGEWVKYNEPVSVYDGTNEEPDTGPKIKNEIPMIVDEKAINDMPWIAFDKLLSDRDKSKEEPKIDPRVKYDIPLNVEEIIKEDVPWATYESAKNDIPLGVDDNKNELPMIGSRMKQDEPSITQERTENDVPWTTYNVDNLLSNDIRANEGPGIGSGIEEVEPLNIEEITKQDMPSIFQEITKEELPWYIEDRKKKDLSWIIDEETKKLLPWTIHNNKFHKPYQIFTYVINPTEYSYQSPHVNKIAEMKSVQYNGQNNGLDLKNLNNLGLTTAYSKYQNVYGNQPPQSYYKSEYSTFEQPNIGGIEPSLSQSEITENESFLSDGPQDFRQYQMIKSNPNILQSNSLSHEDILRLTAHPFSYESLPNQNKIVSEAHASYGIQNNPPAPKNMNQRDVIFQSNVSPNTHGSQANMMSGSKLSVESNVNIDIGNNQPAATQITTARDEILRPNIPSNAYGLQSNAISGKKLSLESNLNFHAGNQQTSTQKTSHNIHAYGTQSQMTMPNALSLQPQVNYNAGNVRPTIQQTSFNNGALLPKTLSTQYKYIQPYNNQVRYINTQGSSPYIYGVKPYWFNSLQQIRPQLASSYRLFSIQNLLKLNENLRISQLNTVDTYRRRALTNLRKIVNVLLILANRFAKSGRGINWYENIFYNVQKNYHPLQPYVYALIRQRWLHELLILLNNNNFDLNLLYNPKILAFLGAWRFPENVISFLDAESLIEEHVDSAIPYSLHDNSKQKHVLVNEVTKNKVESYEVGNSHEGAIFNTPGINADANAVLQILQKHLRFKKHLQKQEEDVVDANKMVVLKEIVIFLKQKGYGPATIADLIRKVHGEVYLAESHGCHTQNHPDVVHHLYNVIVPVLRRSAQ